MRLAEFILHEMQVILAEWEAFATTLLPAAAGMTPLALRDHAEQILEAVARDLASPQTREEQSEKSKGRAPSVPSAPQTAAETHAVLRARSGFNINQLVAEYRALRASVLRLWLDANPLEPAAVDDVIRFNEAIDQAIAESVGRLRRAPAAGMAGWITTQDNLAVTRVSNAGRAVRLSPAAHTQFLCVHAIHGIPARSTIRDA
jgi:hypothetical protein